ncbi:probable serine/threonine-protein kinase At1g01540 isoform X1 [Typha latifolia]|uniref:probable serine/threonine-protein kinase At1g01540 isoform X1 n=1 Tax=Typha latifolia TaxID=4733 RepID=UPI003C2C5BAA
MSSYSSPLLNDELSKRTVVFGLRMWVIVGISVGAAFVLLLFLLSLWLASKRNPTPPIPTLSREIQEIHIDPAHSMDPNPLPEPDHLSSLTERQALLLSREEESSILQQRIHIEIGKDHRITYPERGGSECRSSAEQAPIAAPEVSHLGWGHWYTLRELELATNNFADENVIGEGGYGIVYHGVLEDRTQVAVKNLLNNRGQAEREFKVEVETIGRVRHKNLVRLLGYCAEGAHRILVYEYVDNGNLEQWLHGDVGSCSPLTWEIRMNVILGTAKGLMYLHEGLEPKVVHRDIKSSNILLDEQWNPKVSDFGLAKLLGSDRSYVTTRVMGTFGSVQTHVFFPLKLMHISTSSETILFMKVARMCFDRYVAPEYASTGMLNERSDVYSFGILIMEIISGRNPVDYSRPPGEVNLIEWLKTMVTSRNFEGVFDPKLPEKPSSRVLKRALLVALRCVDPDAHKRPKMGHVIHLLEVDDFPYRDERRAGRTFRDSLLEKAGLVDKPVTESGASGGYESKHPGK